ncbi:hypothetical protein ASG63_08495 [Methylobacterium sp. Leaf94]|uniref:hypothetical protein n=1 Tax=Methylobacterium sp. Leaf94 TaxID=1736250 RepID=UPI0006F44736|nr:hypothetical protein [Methylobacterium sp. Leaf94]KQU17540.1 hypothetical protein ASG63_08495 [Methylobacterium sp. Leaf94]
MDAILTAAVGDAKPIAVIAAVLALIALGWPWIRKALKDISNEDAIRIAGDALRKELGDLLDKEQARVATLTGALEEASTQVRALRGENGGLQAEMNALRREVRAMVRMCLSMRRAMQRAVATGDCAPLQLWLDLNPEEGAEPERPAA